ncbi:RDD family protein [Actinocorallia longicatena]|uniref:RDD domain-containing protein n=1 Tax=Actinocorallia longicatena TaxID=111803 RepID=A0ABN2LF13_9ACTN
MTQPPQDPQNPWENPGGGTPPPSDDPPNQPYGRPAQPAQPGQPGQQGPSFSKDQPGPYSGQGGQHDPFAAPQNPYGQQHGQQPPGAVPPGPGGGQGYGPGGVPPYTGGQDPYGQAYGSGSPMIAAKWKRLVGIIIDGIIFGCITFCISMPFGANTNDIVVTNADGTETYHWDKIYTGGQLFANLIGAVLVFLYFWLLTTRWNGQTLGKKVMKTRVVREDTGGPIDSRAGAIRSGVYVALGWICGCGGLVDAIWIFTNPKNQTLHDKAAGTVVVDEVGPNPYQGYGQQGGGYGQPGQGY